MEVNEINIITLQQETAHEYWQEACRDNEADGIGTLPFWEWYNYYCLENGYFSDN